MLQKNKKHMLCSYWISREGTSPPPGAIFSAHPFPVTGKGAPEPWTNRIEQAKQAIREGRLSKVVLAHMTSRPAPDITTLLQKLKARRLNATVFWFQENGADWLGATPERLFYRRKRRITTEAVAGTRPRGVTAAEDERLAEALLASNKDKSEFDIVVQFIHERLTPLSVQIDVPERPVIRKTHNVQHLTKTMEATLREDVTDAMVIAALHPTPAIAGAPQGDALAWISAYESFTRDYYCGVLGW
ncbi:MAG: hypothetical protein RL235_38, partial [Chlamydiota bacterium]